MKRFNLAFLFLSSLPLSLSLSCDSLLSLSLPNTTIISATAYPQNTSITLPDADSTCDQVASIPVPLCRLVFTITTSSNSSIHAEAWLPDTWNSRFLATGNGGLNGCISYADIAYGTTYGFAAVGTNNGHNGTSGAAFENNPQTVEDFAGRAIHLSAVLGKQIVEAYYGQEHNKAYYIGCSTGGRQGFKAIQNWPEDFDGVVAGAPAFNFNNLLSWSGYVSLSNLKTSSGYVSSDEWELVRNSVVEKCDGIDGLENGIIDDPDLCIYSPEELLCSGNASEGCLSSEQVETVKNVFSPLYGLNEELLMPRVDPGSEMLPLLVGGDPFSYSSDWYHYVVFNSSYDITKLDLTAMAIAEELNPFNISTYSPDITAFQSRGGKVITYHGRQDSLIPAGNSIRYYNLLSQSFSNSTLSEFYRLFLIPGMGHCSGGQGAWMFGQGGGSAAGLNDTEHNVLLAIVDWVESGNAPDTIVGTKYANDSINGEVEVVREYCPYPVESAWDGSSWECV